MKKMRQTLLHTSSPPPQSHRCGYYGCWKDEQIAIFVFFHIADADTGT
jgi:hypothetical protein